MSSRARSDSRQMIMRDQDDQLGEVGQAVGNLREMAVVIHDELDDQNRFAFVVGECGV